MKTLKYLPLIFLVFASSAFSYDQKTEWRAKRLETNSWHLVDMVARRVGDSRLTADARRLARAASIIKFSARRGDFRHVVDRDFQRVERLYNNMMHSFRDAHYAHHRLHEQSDVRALQESFFALRASVYGQPHFRQPMMNGHHHGRNGHHHH